MRSEPLKHWISIQEQSETQDDAGQPVKSWVELHKVRAGISDISGREFMAAQAGQSQVSAKIRIRYLDGITASMRVVEVNGSGIYNIEAPLDQAGDKKWLLLMCSKGVQ